MSASPHPLDVLFLTNFSDFCFRSIPSIAQLADGFTMRLTLMHVYDPARTSARAAGELLDSFFPEADRYASCRRVAAPGPLLGAVKRHQQLWPVNLIVAPSSDPLGWPRLGERSVRARLLEECGVPVWTMGRRVTAMKLVQPVRNVACWMDFRSEQHEHLPFAIEYAQRLGATLHLLRGLPRLEEGQVLPPEPSERSLHPEGAVRDLASLCHGLVPRPRYHVGHGEGPRALTELLARSDADVVFMRDEPRRLSRWFGLGLRFAAAMPCPAVYVGGRLGIPHWNLEPASAGRAARAARETTRVRRHPAVAPA